MAEQEAIKNINALNCVCGQKDFYDEEFKEALSMAIKALEKQIPKKPKCFDDFEAFECPNCGKMILSLDDMTAHNHCLLCGQKLDWSE